MVVKEFPRFLEWLTGGDLLLSGAIATFLLIAVGCLFLGTLFGYFVAVMRHGPFEAFYATANTLFQSVPDFLRTSPRRIFALARLAVKEAFRRKIVLSVLGIFAVALLFGGWYFDSGSEHPERTYIGIVTWGTQLLVLMMGLLISSFSLPDDIKNKTIYTVVTKPVRPTEIILGRILGFAGLATVLLFIMALVCLMFVSRGLSHGHVVDGPSQTIASLQKIDQDTGVTLDGHRIPTNTAYLGATSQRDNHRHRMRVIKQIVRKGEPEPTNLSDVVKVEEDADKKTYFRMVIDGQGGHTHSVSLRPATSLDENDSEIIVGPASGFFRARVPLYAESLLFTDSVGVTKAEGVVTGDEWTYRGYVQGGASLAKATFEFAGIRPDRFSTPDHVEMEMTLGVYRSYKGDVDRRILAEVYFESVPDETADRKVKFQSDPISFETMEFDVQGVVFPRSMSGRSLDENGNTLQKGMQLDFFDNLASSGRVRVILRCADRDQYLGVSRADVYFRAGEATYWVNFFKAFFGIWLQMLIVVTLAVSLSTFLSMPVTMFGTVLVIILGFVSEFIRELIKPEAEGGGPIESFVRVITQRNMQTPLPDGFLTSAMEWVDDGLLAILNALTYIVPDFSKLDFSQYVKFGYWIDGDRLWVATFLALSFCAGLVVFGYFNLKTREIAA